MSGLTELKDVADHVDLESGTAWLSFRLDGQVHKIEAQINEDWVDAKILSELARLLESRHRGRRFTYSRSGLLSWLRNGERAGTPRLSHWAECGMAQLVAAALKPEQLRTGSLGYLGRWGLVQRRKWEPRSEMTSFLWVQVAQRPGSGVDMQGGVEGGI
jgi:hypothetical protein